MTVSDKSAICQFVCQSVNKFGIDKHSDHWLVILWSLTLLGSEVSPFFRAATGSENRLKRDGGLTLVGVHAA